MKRKLFGLIFAGVLVIGVVGCKANDPVTGAPVISGNVTVDNSIASAERSFTLALQIAKLYTDLPRCESVKATAICSDPKIVKKIRDYAIKAHDAILLARKDQNLVALAVEAVGNFTSVLPKS